MDGKVPEIPYDNFQYDFINTSWSESMGEYSTYKESKDGKLDYCINREYFVDYYYDLKQYTVSFDSNGGSGTPDAMTKYYGVFITIPDTFPSGTVTTLSAGAQTHPVQVPAICREMNSIPMRKLRCMRYGINTTMIFRFQISTSHCRRNCFRTTRSESAFAPTTGTGTMPITVCRSGCIMMELFCQPSM